MTRQQWSHRYSRWVTCGKSFQGNLKLFAAGEVLVILVLEGEAALKLACHVDGSDDVMRPPLPLPTCADTPSSSVTMQRGMVTQLLQPTAVPPIALTP